MHVWTNVAFANVEEGRSRKIDVTAITRVAVDNTEKGGAQVEHAQVDELRQPFWKVPEKGA